MRPIAITDISYKLFMSFIGDEIENHIEENNLEIGNQIGFTNGGRTEYNLFVLQYLVDKVRRNKEQLIVITLDFKKAFDSIDRRKLIDALKEYMINPHIIDLIAKIYSNDHTLVTLGNIEEKMEVNSGIKQGCTASTTLFKLITYMIMKKLEKEGDKYVVDELNISSLFFADDSLAMAKTMAAAKKNLQLIIETSKEYGLEINKEKSSIIVYNNKENIKEIDGIKVVENIKYLGLTVDNNKFNIFKTQKEKLIDKTDKSANRTYSVIKRSCNKMMIGKTYWKGVILPATLYGIGLIETTVKERKKLQAIENRVYRTILGARKGTATSCVRGETGASLMDTRIMKARIMIAHSIWNGKNKLVLEVLKRMREDRGNKWNKKLNDYITELGTNFEALMEMTPQQIKNKINEHDTDKWRRDMQEKRSIGIYRRYKKGIKDERIYDNRRSSELLFRARSNTLDLNIEKRHRGQSTACELCFVEEENLEHFMLFCRGLDGKRDTHIINKHWNEDNINWLGGILFDNEEIEKVKQMLNNMWQKRSVEIKKRKERIQTIRQNINQIETQNFAGNRWQ